MAMIRGRVRRDDDISPNLRQKAPASGFLKMKPLKGLKEQRRLMTDLNNHRHPVNTPIGDPDPYYAKKETFLVLNKNNMIFRFSKKKSLFFFDQKSKIRLMFIKLLIHPTFNAIVITTILLNMFVMMINGSNKPEWSETYVENIFTFIYTVEAVTKIFGRGFILHEFSYLRDPWNWLDFVVIFAAYVLIIIDVIGTSDGGSLNSLTFLRVIRVLRVFKTVSVIPGLRMIVTALIASTKALKDAVLLSLLGFSMFSLVGIQLFRGVLLGKCVLSPPWMNCTKLEIVQTTNNATYYNITNLNANCSPVVQSHRQEIQKLFGHTSYHEMLYLENPKLYLSTYTNDTSEGINSVDYSGAMSELHLMASADTTEMTEISSSGLPDDLHNSTWSLVRDNTPRFNPYNFSYAWDNWINNEKHYVMNGITPKLCGNYSTAIHCPDLSMCLKVGQNPNFGYTSFDNFIYAFLSVFRLSMQDNWEELYLQILETSGTLSMLFFMILILLGSYYLVNLILAVVATSYEDQRKNVERALEEERLKKLRDNENLQTRRNADAAYHDISVNPKRKKSLVERTCSCWHIFKQYFLLWTCCVGNSWFCRLRGILKKKLEHPNAEWFTVSLVILNTFVMALEHEPKKQWFEDFLHVSNLVFTSLFTIEVLLKLFAFNVINYFSITWNVFDFIVVALSLVEVFLADSLPDGLAALRTFRLIRLVRILKLAKSWPTLSKLMKMIADSLSKLGYLTLVLLIVLVIFALAGMQTVGTAFYMDKERGIPLRWHMNDFPHAFLVVFRIQCGEWIQSMWSCMHSVSVNGRPAQIPICLFIFLGVVFVGNLVVLNLFLALLLNSFSSDALKTNGSRKKGSTRKFINSIRKAGKSIPKPKLVKRISGNKSKVKPITDDDLVPSNGNETRQHNVSVTNNNGNMVEKQFRQSLSSSPNPYRKEEYLEVAKTDDTLSVPGDNPEMTNATFMVYDELDTIKEKSKERSSSSLRSFNGSKPDSNPSPKLTSPVKKIELSSLHSRVQKTMKKIVTHWVFETIIIFMILMSSCALVFEDVNLPQKPTLGYILSILDKIFTGVFVAEMLMKWIGFGLKKYFKDGWCILDSFIVLVSLISLSLEIHALVTKSDSTDISSLRVLRSLRAFRPLRAMSRFKGIKVVTDALFRSIPSIANVLVICLIFWLVFAIMGINLFAGKMAACRYKETGEKVWHPEDFKRYKDLDKYYQRPPIDVVDEQSCAKLANMTGDKVHWKNLYVTFDNVGISYVALMQIATFKGWMPIMYAAVDAPDRIGQQPVHENNIYNYFFFVAFVIFGAFFTLNLFISVVIDNFNQQKKKFEYGGGELFLTDTQRKAYNAMKNLTARTPSRLLSVPKHYWRQRLYLFVTGDIFELSVMVVTLLNLVVMALEFEGISKSASVALEYINYAFVGLFTIEIILRMIASGLGYFLVPWNMFDFLVIVGSLITNLVTIINYGHIVGESVSASPWLPMLRMIRIARILRVARVASGIRTLLFALMLSLPALINVGSLLFLVMFIFSIFGMSQFSSIEHRGAVTDILNFETFPNAFMLLFQASTSAGWDGFMEPMLYTADGDGDCGQEIHGKSSCMGTTFVGYFYFITYLIITFVVITNMYIAIILENFDLATRDSAEPLTADDFEHYFVEWQRHDHEGEGKLSVNELSEFLHSLDKPLKVKQPNMHKIAEMSIPIDAQGKLHIFDVAIAIIKNILGPEVFTDNIKTEVEDHFRQKSKRLMKNYSHPSLYKTTLTLLAANEEAKKGNRSIWQKIFMRGSQKGSDNLSTHSSNNSSSNNSLMQDKIDSAVNTPNKSSSSSLRSSSSNNSTSEVVLRSGCSPSRCAIIFKSSSLEDLTEKSANNLNNNQNFHVSDASPQLTFSNVNELKDCKKRKGLRKIFAPSSIKNNLPNNKSRRTKNKVSEQTNSTSNFSESNSKDRLLPT